MKVQEVMHKGAEWFSQEASVPEIAKAMRDHDIGAVPIGENGILIGMLTDRDIVCKGIASGENISNMTAADVMTPQIICCEAEDEIDDAIRVMERHQIHRLPVVDSRKALVGILSLGDLSRFVDYAAIGELTRAVSTQHRC